MKLALGTVQFGCSYGVANVDGQIKDGVAEQILKYSKSKGIDTLDTAIAYGNSEQRLGSIGVNDWRIVTKLPASPINCSDISQRIYQQFEDSLRQLNVSHITALLLHTPMQLMGPNGDKIWKSLEQIKSNGQVEKIGFSIYEPAELDQLWKYFRPDIVQVPFNVLDQRMKTSGWFDKLNNNNVELHVRSVFLQGLLLMDKSNRPEKFHHWNHIWKRWDRWLTENNTTSLEATLGYVLSEQAIDRVIVGVDTLKQLKEILSVAHNISDMKFDDSLHQFSMVDSQLINPSNWDSL